MWNGATPSLKARPATTNTRPNTRKRAGRRRSPHARDVRDLGRCRACRWRRRSSTCRRAAGPRTARRARSTSSPPRWRAPSRGCSATSAYRHSDISSSPRNSVRKLLALIITIMPSSENSSSVKNSPRSSPRSTQIAGASRPAPPTPRRSTPASARAPAKSATNRPLKSTRSAAASDSRSHEERGSDAQRRAARLRQPVGRRAGRSSFE